MGDLQRFISDVQSQLGVPYVFGGETPGVGFDCSGLMQWAANDAGFALPRTSEDQFGALPILQGGAMPGDLVFFFVPGDDQAPPQHVGMCWDQGCGTMIDAPFCLPTSTEILTRRGFVKYDQVDHGDETIGYDLATGTARWTEIRSVHRFADAAIVRAGIRRWSVECTPNHRWVTVPQHSSPRLIPLDRIPQGSSIVLAAPALTDGSLPISDAEAAILAWAQGDGTIRRRKPTQIEMTITQSKPEFVEKIRTLLADVPHTETVRPIPDPHPVTYNHALHVWYLRAPYARDLLGRARYFETSASDRVLAMSPSQRAAWLRGIDGVEGTHRLDGDARTVITQNPGDLLDATALCMFLLGGRPSVQAHGPDCLRVAMTSPVTCVRRGQFSVEPAGLSDVWCPMTGLGSWTARQGDRIFLTGNTGTVVRFDPTSVGPTIPAGGFIMGFGRFPSSGPPVPAPSPAPAPGYATGWVVGSHP